MPTITLDHVSKYYRVERRWPWKKPVPDEIGVEDVSLTIEQGEFVSVIGSSGAGKSTLLNLISGEIKPNQGMVSIDGVPVADIRRRKGRQMSTLIGYVPQHQNLNRSITIQENLNEAAKAGGARVISTGRSDYPNQINNVLAFPGIFRGTFDVRASDINEEMKMAAAKALADLISDDELTADYIIPKAFDKRVGGAVAAAVAEAARKTGVARI